MHKSKVRLGYCPSHRANPLELFSRDEAVRYKEMIQNELAAADVEIITIDDVCPDGLLSAYEDVPAVIEKFRAVGIDAMMIALCSFGEEGPTCEVARSLHVPVLLYGPRDGAPRADGRRMRDSQCGLFALGKVLRRFQVPFTYLTNEDPQTGYFRKGIDRFIRVAQTVKAMRNLRILQYGTRPTSFVSVACNEGELMERFGIEVIPIAISDLADSCRAILKKNEPRLTSAAEALMRDFTIENTDKHGTALRLAALKLAIMDDRAKYRASCAALQCWSAIQGLLGIYPCAVNGLLADEGFPVACETDIHGAISAVLLQAAMGYTQPQFFADITVRHPEDDNAELLWHCGPFPPSLAKPGCERCITNHWTQSDGLPGDLAYPLRDGELTVCRFDGLGGEYSLLTGEGHTTNGPHTVGTYVWMKVNDWPLWEHKLVKGPYIHHIAGVYGQCAEVLTEACRYIPGLTPDPCEPGLPELEKRWR